MESKTLHGPSWLHPSVVRIAAGRGQWRRVKRALNGDAEVAAIVSRRGRLVGMVTKALAGDRSTGLQPTPASEMWFIGERTPKQCMQGMLRSLVRAGSVRHVARAFYRMARYGKLGFRSKD